MRGLILLAALALATPACAADPPPIRAFTIQTTEALGREIYRQDTAAWVATDALAEKVRDIGAAGVRGWIVEERGSAMLVRFLRQKDGVWEVAYDVDVSADRTAKVAEPSARGLSPEEDAMWAARQTAVAAMAGVPICRPGYNTVVAKDPEHEGWLVWLLAPMPEGDAIPIGGHYRFAVSADGKTVNRRDALSSSCLVMPPPKLPKGGKPVAAFVTHLVSPTPLETHVFLQLQSRQPLIVGAGNRIWGIEGGHIQDMGPLGPPAKQ